MSGIKPNPDAPHQALINVRWENYERLPDGRCSGRPTTSGSKLFTFLGKNQAEVEEQVNNFMERLDNAKDSTDFESQDQTG